MSSFFGPQDFPRTNATAIYSNRNYCHPLLEKGKKGGIEIGNFTGYIVITEPIHPFQNIQMHASGTILLLEEEIISHLFVIICSFIIRQAINEWPMIEFIGVLI